jgi:RHS repeat-associated protein
MTQRVEGGVTWTQSFNAENRLASVSDGTDTWTFVYDCDGNRVKQVNPDGKISLFLGRGIYSIEDAAGSGEVTKYYSVAGQRVAMRKGTTLSYLLTDHLGSVDAVVSTSGALVSEQRYEPFGAERPIDAGISKTDFGYTGQRDLAAAGLMDYNARWYSETVGVFTQPDTINAQPFNPQNLNRYSYVLNNPINYIDPSGHCIFALVDTLVCLEVIDLVFLAIGSATALYLATPQGREATYNTLVLAIEAAEEAAQNAEEALSAEPAAEVKPLTGDEEKLIGRIEDVAENFLKDHPDLAAEVEAQESGQDLPFNHVKEAEDSIRSLENAIRHLEKVLPWRDAESRERIEKAIEQAREALERIKEQLNK